MKEFIEILIARLEERKKIILSHKIVDAEDEAMLLTYNDSINIVNQLAEEMGVAKNAITNADRIRNMTDEELAKAISRNNTCVRCNIREYCHENIKCRNCVDAVLDWLKEEKEG